MKKTFQFHGAVFFHMPGEGEVAVFSAKRWDLRSNEPLTESTTPRGVLHYGVRRGCATVLGSFWPENSEISIYFYWKISMIGVCFHLEFSGIGVYFYTQNSGYGF